ncbi:unnamed protein product [Agarophyton chilense]
MAPVRVAKQAHSVTRRNARQSTARSRPKASVTGSAKSLITERSERRQPTLANLVQGTVALHYEIQSSQFANWTLARRRAWSRRFTDPSSYFYHYCHPIFDAKVGRWSIQEHCLFLAAISRIPPTEKNWSVVSLLVPGRTGSECRRYYHRIGRAGLITVKGTLRKRLSCRASISTFDDDGKRNGRLFSSNPLFRRSALRRFSPSELPSPDDSLLKPLKTQPTHLSKEQLDALTHIPELYEDYDRKRVVNKLSHVRSKKKPGSQKRNMSVPCRIRLRSGLEPARDAERFPEKDGGNTWWELESCPNDTFNRGAANPINPNTQTPAEKSNPRGLPLTGENANVSADLGLNSLLPEIVKYTPRVVKRHRSTSRKEGTIIDDGTASVQNTSGQNMSLVVQIVTDKPTTKEKRVASVRSEATDTSVQGPRKGDDMNSHNVETTTYIRDAADTSNGSKNIPYSHTEGYFECPGGVAQSSSALRTCVGDFENGDEVMDMEMGDDSECSSLQKEVEMTGDETQAPANLVPRNKKRVLALSRAERSTISYLLNRDDEEPQKKQPRVLEKALGAPEYQGHHSHIDKLEEVGLLIRLFVETVDESGKALGHEIERCRLLRRFNEHAAEVRSGHRNRPLFQAARLLGPYGKQGRRARISVPAVGCSKCLDDTLDNWRHQLNDMMERQNVELNSALKVAQVL